MTVELGRRFSVLTPQTYFEICALCKAQNRGARPWLAPVSQRRNHSHPKAAKATKKAASEESALFFTIFFSIGFFAQCRMMHAISKVNNQTNGKPDTSICLSLNIKSPENNQ